MFKEDYKLTYPALSDFKIKAKKRIPHFAFEYLDSGTGEEKAIQVNRQALDHLKFMPSILRGSLKADFKRNVLGKEYHYPFGIAPIGMSGLIWPGAEKCLAQLAHEHRIPYCLSSVATVLPEDIGPIAKDMGWFQLYTPRDKKIRSDILRRVKEAGFDKLIVTVDVPGESRRERQRRAYISLPPKITLSMMISMMLHPTWSILTALEGTPSLKLPESYITPEDKKNDPFLHAGKLIRGWPTWRDIEEIRDEWQGDLIVKGVQKVEDAQRLEDMGIDAIWVSNHSARQFDGGPAAIHHLSDIKKNLRKDTALFYDSGIEGGLDILRAYACGADFVFMGRAFHYAIAALGRDGVKHLLYILEDDLCCNMAQIGISNVKDAVLKK